MKSRSQCKFFDGCSAQLCPKLSDEENSKCIWYPDEDICRLRKGIPDWVKQQKKVAKKCLPENVHYYFTLAMLKVPFRATKAIKGLDPDNLKEKQQLTKWFKTHKKGKKKRLTAEQIERKRENCAKARKVRMSKLN